LRVPGTTRFSILVVALAICCATPLLAADGGVAAGTAPSIPFILVGFVGGFVRHDNPNQGPVQFAQSARRILPKNSYVQVFENRHRKAAYKAIVRLLDRDHDGSLSGDEKARAHIVLFGHSWGGSAVVLLARDLDRAGIPVLLTVQVDSVRKPWQHDDLIPANVAAAINFYQPHGIIHGRSLIRAADESKTQILGNYRFDYQQAPVKCDGTSWFDRAFMGQHMQSECDPHIWQQVENLVHERTEPVRPSLAALPGQ
jgi:pimeloyl-ACP methyl ester carboxylesterase